jgi:putative DNA methylase
MNPTRTNILEKENSERAGFPKVIEDGFPFEIISQIAEIESWRKEIYRPIYHLHKWWAQRLGSVFRAAILGAAAPQGSSVVDLFYQPINLSGLVVFDPFMGSGTTIGEAYKLGCTVIGRDINPVAYRAVKTAMGPMSRIKIKEAFHIIDEIAGHDIRSLYKAKDSDGNICDVLYYFWVKVITCPLCNELTDLFSSFIFSKHSYAALRPSAHAVCPDCSSILTIKYNTEMAICDKCDLRFNPTNGWAKRKTVVCKSCKNEFPIAKTLRLLGHPPSHRLFAKLVLRHDGNKEYLEINKGDIDAYRAASDKLISLDPPLPRVKILPGYNTNQILNYGYNHWHELFNKRQLLALTLLAKAIQQLPDVEIRDAFSILFSGVLEFNNMFASFKGEGTGAVRHMFSHHILKPERTPIEANVWGTPKSSGSFSTLYRSRLLRALDYRDAPFEVAVEDTGKNKKGKKVFGINQPIGTNIASSFDEMKLKKGRIYLSNGDSSNIDLPNDTVNLIITDPPFFDNVHYSELADFFYVWQELYFNSDGCSEKCTTRRKEEVQDADPESFARKLKQVFRECYRVLKEDGLLIFSYHYSREEGWISLATALMGSGFSFIQSQPVKSEMSVAAPKSQAKEPIDIDVLFVCRKRHRDKRPVITINEAINISEKDTTSKITRFNLVGKKLSRNDVRVIFFSQLLVEFSAGRDENAINGELRNILLENKFTIESLWDHQHIEKPDFPLPHPYLF